MHWSTEPFIETHECIQAVTSEPGNQQASSVLQHLFDEVCGDLKDLLRAPPKSDDSRQKLQKGIIVVDGVQYQVNPDFIGTAYSLADELSLDELVAAEIIQSASSDSTRLDISLLEAGVAFFYVRRQYILDLLLFFLSQAIVGDSSPLTIQCKKFVNRISSEGNIIDRVIESMKSVESSLNDVDEKENRGNFLGQTQSSEFVQILKLRRDFLYREHDTLGRILYATVENNLASQSDITSLFERIRNHPTYNTILIHYLPAIFLYSSTFDPILATAAFNTALEEAQTLCHSIRQTRNDWKLPYFRGAIELISLSYFSGCCKNEQANNKSLNFSYDEMILTPVKSSIDDGALEMLMALAADISGAKNKSIKFYDFRTVFQFRVPSFEVVGQLSDDFLDILLRELERIVESIIANLADVLKEMRLTEEDVYLALAHAEPYDNSIDTPGVDLERFFTFISYLYADRADAALSFWGDSESNLYGFIVWGSQLEVPFMSAAYCDMLASLSNGPKCATAAYTFLADAVANAHVASSKPKLNRKVCWQYIFGVVSYYAQELEPKPRAPTTGTVVANNTLPTSEISDLEDDSLVVLWSYLRLISEVVGHDTLAKAKLLEDPIDPIAIILKLLISYTPLYGAALYSLASFAKSTSIDQRTKIWEKLDKWAFDSVLYGPDGIILSPLMPARNKLYNIFKSFDDIVGFATLIEELLSPVEDINEQFVLPFPETLGGKYRATGVWPYVDFMINEIFGSSSSSDFSQSQRLALQLPCLKFIIYSIESFDSEAVRLSSLTGINLDHAVKGTTFLDYIRVHPCVSIVSDIFKDKIYSVLFGIIQMGIDEIAELPASDPLVETLLYSLNVVNLVLDVQDMFIDFMSSGFRYNSEEGSTAFSTHGLRRFEDALLFNLPIVSHLALYVGSANIDIASTSLELLKKMSLSPQFMISSGMNTESRIRKNRLLSTFETVDESTRIKESIIEQLERDIASYEVSKQAADGEFAGVNLKLNLLKFIIVNLKNTSSNDPTIAHFLLGFKVNGDGTLDLDTEHGGILSSASAFNSVINLLEFAVSECANDQISWLNAEIASACSEIIYLLIDNWNTCMLVLNYLRERDLFQSIMSVEPVFDSKALWDGHLASSQIFLESKGPEAMVSFFKHRASLLEFLSMELHVSAENGALSLISRYLELLVDMNSKRADGSYAAQSARILSFLDVLEQRFVNSSNEVLGLELFGPHVLDVFQRSGYDITEDESVVVELKHLLKLRGLELVATKDIKSLEDSKYLNAYKAAVSSFTGLLCTQRIRNTQLLYLNSWTKLVLVIVNDGKLDPSDRITFILQTIQTIVPKLVDYSSRDVEFAGSLSSLAVSLFKIYQDDIRSLASGQNSTESTALVPYNALVGYDRVYGLFKAALTSIQSSISTSELRTDFYIICYQYLKLCLGSSSARQQIGQVIKNSGDKLLEIVCTDAISGEGVTRLIALVFLEVLCLLASSLKSSFVLDGLVRYNLLLMVVRSIARIDDEIVRGRESSDDALIFYQLNAFKATLYFILQVSQSRAGANQVIQCGFFDVIKSCKFLTINPDVGIHLATGTDFGKDLSIIAISAESGSALYFELLIPIFQVVIAILLSMGPENEPVIQRIRQFLESNQQLLVNTLKKDSLLDSRTISADSQLRDLVKLQVLLITLTDFAPLK